jgi:hypothetical protein
MRRLGHRRSWRDRTVALLAAAWLASPAPAASAPDPSDPEARLPHGAQEWALAVGHGLGFALGSSGQSDVEDVEFVALVPRWGLVLTDRLGADAWYAGNLEILVEGAFLQAYEPKGGFAGGGTLGLRWNLLGGRRIVPFVEIAGGIVDLDFDLEHQANGISFTPQGGAGLHFMMSGRMAITGEWRFHHISNADLRDDNDGINDSLFLVGFSFFPE